MRSRSAEVRRSLRAAVSFGLTDPQPQRLAVDTEIARDMGDRPAALEHEPHAQLTQLIRVLGGTRHPGRLSFRQDRSSWPRSLHETRDGSPGGSGRLSACFLRVGGVASRAGPQAVGAKRETAMVYRTWRVGPRARWRSLLVGVFVSAWLLAAGSGAAGATPAASLVSGTPLAPAAAAAQLSLPAPTGPRPIGVRSGFLADASRIDPATGKPRTLPIRVWYPARHAAAGRPAPYFSAPVQRAVEQELGVPTGTFDVDTHASTDAPMRRHLKGVILVSAGLGEPVALQTSQVIELASRGWVLVTFDHPHDTFVVEQPDGTLIFSDLEPSLPAIEAAFEQRVLDVGVVLRQLATLLPRRQSAVPVGMFGFSIGGAAAAESLLRYPRLQAGVDLDGSPFGRVVHEGLDEPFGIMLGRRPLEQDPSLSLLISRLRGPHPFEQLDIEHHGFTDFVVLNPAATLADPALGALLEANFATGVDSLAAGTAALSAQRRFLTRFMRRYLRACHDNHARARRGAVPLPDRLRAPREVPAERRSRCGGDLNPGARSIR